MKQKKQTIQNQKLIPNKVANPTPQTKHKSSGKLTGASFFVADLEFSRNYPALAKTPIVNMIAQFFYKEGWFYSIALLMVAVLFTYFAMSYIGYFVIPDDPDWIYRISFFWNAVKNGDWNNAFGHTYPGLIPIYLAGITTKGINMQDFAPEEFHNYLAMWRTPIVWFNLISLFFIYALARRKWNSSIAFMLTAVSALHPFILSLSQKVQADATLWNTFIITIISLMLYIQEGKKRFMILTALFFSFAILSKFAGLILYPLLFVILYFYYIFNKIDKDTFTRRVKGLGVIYLMFLFFTYLMWPACWKSIGYLFERTFFSTMLSSIRYLFPIVAAVLLVEIYALNGVVSDKIRSVKNFSYIVGSILSFVLLGAMIFTFINIKTGQSLFQPTAGAVSGTTAGSFLSALYQPLETFLGTQPWFILLFFAAALVLMIIPSFANKLSDYQIDNIILLFTFIAFSAGTALGGFVTTWKYQIVMIPVIILVISFAFQAFPAVKFTSLAVVVFALIEVGLIFPFYEGSASKRGTFDYDIPKYGTTCGGYEIAQVANKLPNYKNTKILSDAFMMPYFFGGQNTMMDRKITGQYIRTFDYMCLSSFGMGEKTNWKMVTPALQKYYDLPKDSCVAFVGSEKGWIKLVKVNKNVTELTIPNTFDPEFYLPLSKPFTLAFWTKIQDPNPGNPFFIGLDFKTGISIEPINNQGVAIGFRWAENQLLQTTSLMDNNWHHVCFQWAGGQAGNENILLVDGKKLTSEKILADKKSDEKFFISQAFRSGLQDIRIYDFLLSDKQLGVIYNNGVFKLDEKLNDGAADFSPVQHYTLKVQQ